MCIVYDVSWTETHVICMENTSVTLIYNSVTVFLLDKYFINRPKCLLTFIICSV